MKYNIQIFFVMSAFLLSCNKASVLQPKEKNTVTQFMVLDYSTTWIEADPLTLNDALDMMSIYQRANQSARLIISHMSQKFPNPITCEIDVYNEEIQDFDFHRNEKLHEKLKADSLNNDALQQLQSDFKEKITDFERTKENDFTYVSSHLRSLSFFLGDTTVPGERIGVISSDFKEDLPPKHGDWKFINSDLVNRLNSALIKNPQSSLYIVGGVDTIRTPLASLDATFIGTWAEMKMILKNKFPHAVK